MPLFGPPSATPALHATTHKSGGTDVIKLNEFGAPTAQVDLGSQKIVNLAAPTLTTDAARKTDLPVAGTGASNFIAGNDSRIEPTPKLPIAVKTSAYTASAGELVLCDASTASFAVTLPTAPADQTRVTVSLVATTTTNTVTISRGGTTDVIGKPSGTTTITLSMAGESAKLQYNASGGVWYKESGSAAVTALDSRYPVSSSIRTIVAISPSAYAGLATPDPNTLYALVTPSYLVQDSYTGTRTDTWTPSDSGATYTLSGTTTDWQVNGGIGKVSLSASSQDKTALVASVSAVEQEAIVKWKLPVMVTANNIQLYFMFRWQTSLFMYRVRTQITSAGVVSLQPQMFNTTQTDLGSTFNMPSFTYTAGTWMWTHAQCTGSGGTTTIRARVWQDGTTEPTTWQVSQTDTTSGLQVAGSTGLWFRTSSSFTPLPFEVDVDEYSVV